LSDLSGNFVEIIRFIIITHLIFVKIYEKFSSLY
jgi:hypothetical protein